MNNSANYPPQNPYGYMPQGQMQPQHQSFQPSSFPNQFQQHGYAQQHPGYQQGFSQSPTPQIPSGYPTSAPGSSTPTSAAFQNNMMAQQNIPGANLAQQAQMQNAAQAAKPVSQPQSAPLSPQMQQREKARVTVLLDINTALLQEVVSLQTKGLAGQQTQGVSQSPNSPNPTDGALNNSPTAETPKGKPSSPEYNECMRRLQANLSYLATLADAKKKTSGSVPAGPAIMIPPPHLASVQELYKKLNQLFPEASQSTINKAMAFASAQANKQNQPVAG